LDGAEFLALSGGWLVETLWAIERHRVVVALVALMRQNPALRTVLRDAVQQLSHPASD
jgi:hypothetical protein